MKHLKRLFENTVDYQSGNDRIRYDIDVINGFLDDIEEKYKGNYSKSSFWEAGVKCYVRLGNLNGSISLLELSKYIKDNINTEIPTINYNIVGKLGGLGNPDYIMELVSTLKNRLQDTDCRIEMIKVNSDSSYMQQYNNKMVKLGANQKIITEGGFRYLVSNEIDVSVNIVIMNLRTRY